MEFLSVIKKTTLAMSAAAVIGLMGHGLCLAEMTKTQESVSVAGYV